MTEHQMSHLLTRDVVDFNVPVEDWEDAVRKVLQLLVKNGAIQSSYIDAAVAIVEKLGPYIVLAPGIALAHARPDDGVNFAALSLITLQQPVEFGNPDNDPVHLVFGLASTGNEKHIELIRMLAEFLDSEQRISALRNAVQYSDIEELLVQE